MPVQNHDSQHGFLNPKLSPPILDIFVEGIPKAQPRIKATSFNGKLRVYTPNVANGWKQRISIAILPFVPQIPYTGPMSVNLVLYFPRPQRLMKKTSPDQVWHAIKPDRDNLDKAVLDSLTQLKFWFDDSQVCDGHIQKTYTPKDGTSGLWISVSKILENFC